MNKREREKKRHNPEDSLKHTKEQLIVLERNAAMFIFPLEIFVYRLQSDAYIQRMKGNIACSCGETSANELVTK